MGFSVNRRNSLRSPACAGKRFAYSCKVDAARDHPRVCGEKSGYDSTASACLGSPPRVRGKDFEVLRGIQDAGITPACAGKRSRGNLWTNLQRDHPRVCGEKDEFYDGVLIPEGSPPRVRGKDRKVDRDPHARGITPACAGKSRSPAWVNSLCQDHPRVCGEKFRSLA